MSSVYFWDLDDGFAGVVLLKKSMYIGCFLREIWAMLLTSWG